MGTLASSWETWNVSAVAAELPRAGSCLIVTTPGNPDAKPA